MGNCLKPKVVYLQPDPVRRVEPRQRQNKQQVTYENQEDQEDYTDYDEPPNYNEITRQNIKPVEPNKIKTLNFTVNLDKYMNLNNENIDNAFEDIFSNIINKCVIEPYNNNENKISSIITIKATEFEIPREDFNSYRNNLLNNFDDKLMKSGISIDYTKSVQYINDARVDFKLDWTAI